MTEEGSRGGFLLPLPKMSLGDARASGGFPNTVSRCDILRMIYSVRSILLSTSLLY